MLIRPKRDTLHDCYFCDATAREEENELSCWIGLAPLSARSAACKALETRTHKMSERHEQRPEQDRRPQWIIRGLFSHTISACKSGARLLWN